MRAVEKELSCHKHRHDVHDGDAVAVVECDMFIP